MASIPSQSIKKLIKKYTGVNITNDGASALGKILEREAKTISRYAVGRARKHGRLKITKDDIKGYVIDGE
ncbi:MAG: NFYB/HAP3 family transcription factor subunit [Candidatus Micrarchaeota archaeon]|nr:NFYB/HAP3 family transcription factor subunit [Candidatus Micrarchaeota archaeon]